MRKQEILGCLILFVASSSAYAEGGGLTVLGIHGVKTKTMAELEAQCHVPASQEHKYTLEQVNCIAGIEAEKVQADPPKWAQGNQKHWPAYLACGMNPKENRPPTPEQQTCLDRIPASKK